MLKRHFREALDLDARDITLPAGHAGAAARRRSTPRLEAWGGIECTVNRVNDDYHDQLARSGHLERLSDLDRFAELGIRALRYPVLWERTAPDGLDAPDW